VRNAVISPGLGGYDVSGIALFAYGRIYRDAGRRLRRKPPPNQWPSPVPYFLLCQSLELYLKGYLWRFANIGRETLKRKYGHNVPKLWNDAQAHGLGKYARATKDRNDVIALVGPVYRDRKLNYLDLNLLFVGYQAIHNDARVIPTLLRLTHRLDTALISLVAVNRQIQPVGRDLLKRAAAG
jgi:hypothetical protein